MCNHSRCELFAVAYSSLLFMLHLARLCYLMLILDAILQSVITLSTPTANLHGLVGGQWIRIGCMNTPACNVTNRRNGKSCNNLL